MTLTSPVGKGCPNERSDVKLVQQLLRTTGLYEGHVDGICGAQTIAAITHYQRAVLRNPDGRIDPGGPTWERLVQQRPDSAIATSPGMPTVLTESDYEEAAQLLACEVAAIKAVAEVESAGAGFLKNGKLRILFEGHWFYRHTNGAHAATHPTLCHRAQTNDYYARGNAEQRGAREWARLEAARQLNSNAALLSCSVGKFQVMGFNHKLCGFDTVEEFWQRLALDEREHLRAFCGFVKSKGLADHLIHHRWISSRKDTTGKAIRSLVTTRRSRRHTRNSRIVRRAWRKRTEHPGIGFSARGGWCRSSMSRRRVRWSSYSGNHPSVRSCIRAAATCPQVSVGSPKRLASEDLLQVSAEEAADAWRGYFGYWGSFRVDAVKGVVAHRVEGSSFANWIGTEQVRRFRFDTANRLVLEAHAASGHTTLIRERVGPAITS